MQRIELPDVWDARESDRGFLGSLATFAFLALGLELVVDGTVLTFTGTVRSLYPLGWQCLTWTALGALWCAAAWALVLWARRRGVDPLPPDPRRLGPGGSLDHRAWRAVLTCAVGAVVVAVVLPAVLGAPRGLAPVTSYRGLYAEYGGAAWLAVLAWAVHLVGRSMLLASILGYAHRAAVETAVFPGSARIPWGGLVLGVLTGTVALLSQGSAAALTSLAVSLLLGTAHVRDGEALRVTAPITLLAFAAL